MYFYLPRVVRFEWPFPKLISAHFWLVFVGFGVYFIGLSIGGLLQGLAMLDATKTFMDSVAITLPYLAARSVGGTLMTLGHIAFAAHVFALLFHVGRARSGAALFTDPSIIPAE